MKRNSITHEFVEFIPDQLEEGIVYISIKYATAMHLCCCGCGREVSTQLSPTDWRLTFDGETISLHPSIGRWNWPCQAHYWIRRNRVEWAGKMSRSAIEAGRATDRTRKAAYYGDEPVMDQQPTGDAAAPKRRDSLWSRLRRRLTF